MPTKQSFNFEKAFSELEEIVRKFEAGEIGLEQGLKDFERGLELAKQLETRLKEAENKITEIKKRFGADSEEIRD